MTTDELKKEAEESFEKYRVTDIDYVVSPYSDDEGEKKLMFNNEYDAEEEYFRLYSKGYLASAEPREKRIAELEKINADGLSELNHTNGDLIIENEKLKKENAELKGLKDVATLIRANNDTVTTLMQLNNMLVSKTQQLTKAKNLLQKVADVCGYPNYDIPVELYANIADFLKESEVEK